MPLPTDLKVGSVLPLVIEKLTLGGDGLARLNAPSRANFVVFVPYSAPGDRLKIEVTEVKKNFARGKILEVLQPSEERAKPPCPYYFQPGASQSCGGCSFQHLKYPYQGESKAQALRETIAKIAKLNPDAVMPILADPERQWRYRNKIQIPFRRSAGGKTIAGFFAQQSHDLVPIEDCKIHSETVMNIVNAVREKMDEWNLRAYDERQHSGWLRHLLVREDFSSGELLVVMVSKDDSMPHRQKWVQLFGRDFPNVAGFLQNVNPDRTNVILGRKWNPIFGRDFLVEKLDDLGPMNSPLKLKVSAGSFFQVNTNAAKALYQTARDFCLTEAQRSHVLDLYCGVGGIGLALAPHFEKVTGVEESGSSISDAEQNCKSNGIANCEFIRADAEAFLSRNIRGREKISAVVLDPPRAGCSEAVLRRILSIEPGTVVYVSCEPSTLARDLGILCERKYDLKKIQPLDLFAQSAHVESIALLKKKKCQAKNL